MGGTNLGAQKKPGPLPELFQAISAGQVRVIDLTYALDAQSPYWPDGSTQSPFRASPAATFEHDGMFARNLALPEHFGTHVDAPAHFDSKGLTVDQVPVKDLLREAIVVDVSEAASSNADYRVTATDLEHWEKIHGPMPRGCLVLIRTGWASRWPSQSRYMNEDARGVFHFPGISLDGARYVLGHAHPAGIGIDTPSVDYGPSKTYEVHHLTLSAGIYHLENVANLDQLPATGTYVIALPLKLHGGSGGSARVLALVPAED
jgi:kynurenine formamidase